jgi:hypothetical protein
MKGSWDILVNDVERSHRDVEAVAYEAAREYR